MRAVNAPRLETARLILRPHEQRDFDAFSAMWRDPVVIAHTIKEPRSTQDAWMTLHRLLGSWPLLGYGFWAVAWRETDEYLGDCGFMDAMRPETPDKRGLPELGYALRSAWHGRGLITEALGAVHGWLDDAMPGTGSFALIDDANPASLRVARKFGYRFERRHDQDGRKGGLYARNRLPETGAAD